MPQNYYRLLGIEVTATHDEIKAAYRRLARQFHPDINPSPDAERRFKEIGEAYGVLSDRQKRMAYDLSIGILQSRQPSQKEQTQSASKKEPPRSPSEQGQTKSKPSTNHSAKSKTKREAPKSSPQKEAPSFFDVQGTKFKEMFDGLFRQEEAPAQSKSQHENTAHKSSGGEKPVRGDDITVELTVTRSEAGAGTVKSVSIEHQETCKRCSGYGKVNSLVCTVCQGAKKTALVRKIDVRIPQGIKDGSKIRVAKEGIKGSAGGDDGDLFLLIRIPEDHRLTIEGLNVLCELPISVLDAVLGAEMEVPTLHGSVKMTIPPLTSSGKVFKLKGQGVTAHGTTGDQLVTVQIVMPQKLSPQEKELYQTLAKLQKGQSTQSS